MASSSSNVTSRKVFVNLSVKDLASSVAFWTTLGFEFDARFTDEHAACMLLSDEGFVMLLDEPRFKDFTKKAIAVAATHTEVINALSAGSREEVDELVRRALANGGKPANDPIDYGFMYSTSFFDLDGHHWEVMWMEPAAVEQGPEAYMAAQQG